jgi:hypothetical protein
LEGLKEGDHLGDQIIDGVGIKWNLKKQDITIWIKLFWLRIGVIGGLL